MTFIPLPLDVARCHPQNYADSWCRQCRRYADHPEQTWGDSFTGSPAFSCHGSDSEDCRFIPINPEHVK